MKTDEFRTLFELFLTENNNDQLLGLEIIKTQVKELTDGQVEELYWGVSWTWISKFDFDFWERWRDIRSKQIEDYWSKNISI